MAVKNHIAVGASVVDRDYRVEIEIVVINHEPAMKIFIKNGDRVAQLIFERI